MSEIVLNVSRIENLRNFFKNQKKTKFDTDFLREIGKIVRVIYLTKKNKKFGCLLNRRYCADRAQNLPGPTPNNAQCFRFHPNRFTFGGVIDKRVNTVYCPVECFYYRFFEPIIILRHYIYF